MFFPMSILTGRERNHLSFEVKNLHYFIAVQRSFMGTDIILHGVKTENLSFNFPGENLFPEVQIEADNFFITWIHYQKNNVRICWYDSMLRESKILTFSGFNFIGAKELIFDETHKPWGMVFLGNNSDNDDLFVYNFFNRQLKNLTLTPVSEKNFLLEKEGNAVFIKTETLESKYIYKLNCKTFKNNLVKEDVIEREVGDISVTWNQTTLNSIIGYGDSITAGKMRMNDLEGTGHPELTYLAKLQEMFAEEYGETYIINLGKGGANSYDAVQDMYYYFFDNKAFFCLILFGTNDVGSGVFSASSSAENLKKVALTCRDTYGMFPIISTVPPQKYYLDGVQFFKEQTEALNQKIISMAIKNNIAYIDSYKAFFDYPDGWEVCLEDIQGRHPSPTGHQVMADLFKPIILDLNPEVPVNFSTIDSNLNAISVQWDENFEFDFSHYLISFGFSTDQLDHLTQSSTNSFLFANIPFNATLRKQIYLKIQAVDKDGNTSAYSNLFEIEFGE